MRVLLVGDIHLADRPPSIRTESYCDDIFAKLEQTVEIAIERDLDHVVWAGDVFHVKAPTRTSHRIVQRAADIVKAYDRPLWIVPGNHDVQHDRLESLDGQPLGVLFKAGAFPLIGNQLSGMFGIPWLFDWNIDIRAYMEAWQDCDAELMVTHAPIVPPGETRPFEVVDAEMWATGMGRPGSVYYGHMHDPDGSYQVTSSDTRVWQFCNQGAISRGSLHESTLRREPAVTIYDSSADDGNFDPFEVIPLKFRPAEEVFRLDVKRIDDAKTERLEEFLDQVGSTTLETLTVEAVRGHVAGMELRPGTRELIDEVLEDVLSR